MQLPPSIEIVFVSGLYGLIFWDELIQDYDCHFADYTDDSLRSKVSDRWGNTLSDALIQFLQSQSRAAPIRAVYDLLSESLYQNLFRWEKIQGAAVHHRIFKNASGPDVLVALARVLGANIAAFCNGTYKQGWHKISDREEVLEFGFEARLGDDPLAMREGEMEKTRNRLLRDQPWLNRLSGHLRDALVLAELSWRKVEDAPKYEWGGIAVSFIKPVERLLRDQLRLAGRETLGTIVMHVRTDPAWRQTYTPLQRLNELFIRAKHLEPPPIVRLDIPTIRSLTFEVLRFAAERRL
jgi:hypothetical protein